jgi:hypothetical protein
MCSVLRGVGYQEGPICSSNLSLISCSGFFLKSRAGLALQRMPDKKETSAVRLDIVDCCLGEEEGHLSANHHDYNNNNTLVILNESLGSTFLIGKTQKLCVSFSQVKIKIPHKIYGFISYMHNTTTGNKHMSSPRIAGENFR